MFVDRDGAMSELMRLFKAKMCPLNRGINSRIFQSLLYFNLEQYILCEDNVSLFMPMSMIFLNRNLLC